MRRLALPSLVLSLALACASEGESEEAGVGGDRTGCGEPGSNSVPLADHSCTCEPGFDWCSGAIDDFTCCEVSEPTDTGSDEGLELPCGPEQVEQLACVLSSDDSTPAAGVVWACNGERWVEAPGLAEFECMAEGYSFAFGCLPDPSGAAFSCGFGPGSPCDPDTYVGLCEDEDIIDTCVWGRRTVDRCSRLCSELEAFGPGFSSGGCTQTSEDSPATCTCT